MKMGFLSAFSSPLVMLLALLLIANNVQSYDGMTSKSFKGATVKKTCMADDKEIVGYGKTKINEKDCITMEGYDYAKFGRKGCKAKVIYCVPKALPFKIPSDIHNGKTGAKLEVKSETYNDVLFQGKAFANPDETLSLKPLVTSNPTAIAYHQLVVQWAPGVCTGIGKTCKIPWPQDFSIHGLWPEIKDKHTANISPESFDIIKLKAIEKQLKAKWPTLETNKDEDFWKHEWNYHGFKSELGLVGYFKMTLNLYGQVIVLLEPGLTQANIYPDNTQSYNLKDIEAALKEVFKVDCSVQCVWRRTANIQQIKEIRFNFTTGFQLQSTVGGSPSCNPNYPIAFPL